MLQHLLQDIARYFDHLQAQGLYVSFHNLAIPMESCMASLTPYNINSNPFCLLVKSSSDAWTHCIERQHKVLAACGGGPFCGMCYAGMGECVFPIRSVDGTPLAFISVSGYRLAPEQALARISAVAERYGHARQKLLDSYWNDLKPEQPDLEALSVQIAPLCRMFELLHVMLGSYSQDSVGSMTQSCILGHAVVYLRRHYSEEISAADVAAACHCSVSSLSHLFKQKLGVGIRTYLRQLRLADAKRLLRDTDLPVSTISDLLGYGNPNYFCNVFREETGVSPRKFRQQQGRSAGEAAEAREEELHEALFSKAPSHP